MQAFAHSKTQQIGLIERKATRGEIMFCQSEILSAASVVADSLPGALEVAQDSAMTSHAEDNTCLLQVTRPTDCSWLVIACFAVPIATSAEVWGDNPKGLGSSHLSMKKQKLNHLDQT